MDQAFVCSICHSLASRCCLCVPERVFLCYDCIQCHMGTSVYHALAPATLSMTVTLADYPQYLQRSQAAEKYIAVAQELMNRLQSEKLKVSEIISDLFQRKESELHEACCALNSEYTSYYEKQIGELRAIERNINEMVEDTHSPTPETLKFIDFGLHSLKLFQLVEKCKACDIAITVKPAECFSASHVTSAMGESIESCNCASCESTAAQLLSRLAWKCRFCNYSANLAENCQKCNCPRHFAQPIPPDPTHTVQLHLCPNCRNPCSVDAPCDLCGFYPTEANKEKMRKCESCHRFNATENCTCVYCDRPMPLSSKSVSADCWRCAVCGFSCTPSGKSICSNCNFRPTPFAPSWKCWECGRLAPAADTHCQHCGMSKKWDEYLQLKGVQLSSDKSQWQCVICGYYTLVSQSTCKNCSTTNEFIADARVIKRQERFSQVRSSMSARSKLSC